MIKTTNLTINENKRTIVYNVPLNELDSREWSLYNQYTKLGFTSRKKRATASNAAHKKEYYLQKLDEHARLTGDSAPIKTFIVLSRNRSFAAAVAWYRKFEAEQKASKENETNIMLSLLGEDPIELSIETRYILEIASDKATAEAGMVSKAKSSRSKKNDEVPAKQVA